nr:uncharacterized protein LOC104106128 isoform X5 [Nicotiana tomentosiformis]
MFPVISCMFTPKAAFQVAEVHFLMSDKDGFSATSSPKYPVMHLLSKPVSFIPAGSVTMISPLQAVIAASRRRSFVEQKKLKRRAISFTGMVLPLNALSQLVKNYHSKRGRSTAFKRQIFGSSSWDSVETTSRY